MEPSREPWSLIPEGQSEIHSLKAPELGWLQQPSRLRFHRSEPPTPPHHRVFQQGGPRSPRMRGPFLGHSESLDLKLKGKIRLSIKASALMKAMSLQADPHQGVLDPSKQDCRRAQPHTARATPFCPQPCQPGFR